MDKRTFSLQFTKKDRVIYMGENSPYPILTIGGFEASDYEISFAANAMAHGSSITGIRIQERSLSVSFDVPDSMDFHIYRQELIKFFNPLEEISMIVDYNGIKREIFGRVEEFTFSNSNLYERLHGNLSLICPQPFFLDLNHYGKNIAAKTAMFAFPFFIPRRRGRAMSYKTLKQNVSLPNAGDVETGIEMIFKATRGTVKNPKMEKLSSGEYMRVIVDMKQGDVLKITTNTGKKRIELNGVNVVQKIDRNSSFFAITPGDNILKYSADENYTNLDVTLYYTPRYLGV